MDFEERRHPSDRRVVPSVIAAHVLRRLSWHAIMAGALLSLAAQLTLIVMGHALGIGGAGAPEAASGFWKVIVGVASIAPGAWAAARTAGIPARPESASHGLFVWAVSVLASESLGVRYWGFASVLGTASGMETLWTFLSLLLSAVAASITGWYAAPHDVSTYPRRQSVAAQ